MATTSKTLQTRIKLKYDSYENWSKNNPILLGGELAAVYIAAKPTKEANSVAAPQILFKVGDGVVSSTGEITGTNFNSLPWASGLAADVYDWAKATLPPVASVTANNGAKATKDGTNAVTVTADLLNYTKNTAEAAKGGGTKVYAVELDKNGHLMVAVPWTDTDTVYTGDSPISVDAATKKISHEKKGPTSTYTSANTTTKISGSGGTGTIKIPQLTVDTYGHVTAAADESVEITMPTVPNLAKGTATGGGNVITDFTVNGHTITPAKGISVYTKEEVNAKIAGAVQYLGTVTSVTELNALTPDSVGDFCRVSTAFTYGSEALHAGDLLLCKTLKSGNTAATWDVVHGEIDKYTWVANSKTSDGYVTKGSENTNAMWATDDEGNPSWKTSLTIAAEEKAGENGGYDKEVYTDTVVAPAGNGVRFAGGDGIKLRSVNSVLAHQTQVIIDVDGTNTDPNAPYVKDENPYATIESITNAINNLDYTDTPQTGYYVSKVDQTDGKITVTRTKLPDTVAPNAGKLLDRAGNEVFNANQSDNSQIMIIDCGTSSTVL